MLCAEMSELSASSTAICTPLAQFLVAYHPAGKDASRLITTGDAISLQFRHPGFDFAWRCAHKSGDVRRFK